MAKEPNFRILVIALLFKEKLILDIQLLQKQLDHHPKLYYFTRPTYLGVLALAKKLKDINIEVGGQRLIDTKI